MFELDSLVTADDFGEVCRETTGLSLCTCQLCVLCVLGDLHLIRRLIQRAALQQSDRGSGSSDPRTR